MWLMFKVGFSLTFFISQSVQSNSVWLCSVSMEASIISPAIKFCPNSIRKPLNAPVCRYGSPIVNSRRITTSISAVQEISTIIPDSDQAGLTWEIVVGTVAGVTPFVVAGIEFSKRIVEQKKCTVCRGSGLVKREKYYFRCPRCGGFLPWQSWKRFFSG